jgi:hypothetical protein
MRKGMVGDWRNYLSPEQVKVYFVNILTKLNYDATVNILTKLNVNILTKLNVNILTKLNYDATVYRPSTSRETLLL